MGYFGKCEHEIDAHGPCSVKIVHPKRKESTAIALRFEGDIFAFTYNNELKVTQGIIATCQYVDMLPESGKFSLDEPTIWKAIIKKNVEETLEK